MEKTIRRYPIAIEVGDDEHAYGIAVPDVAGCFSAGDSLDEALKNASEAIHAHFEILANDQVLPPLPQPLDVWRQDSEYKGWAWGVVEIDVTPYLGKSSKVNVTLPNLLQKQIEDAIQAHPEYKNRSHFLQYCAAKELEKLQQQDSNRDNL